MSLLQRDPDGGRVRSARWGLGLLAGLLVALLLVLPKPWGASTGPGFFATPDRSMTETILTAGWWACLANLGLALLLAATAGWWARPLPVPRFREPWPARPGAGFLALLLLAVLLGGALRWNLAHTGLWWDELWSVKRTVVGHRTPVPDRPGELEFHPVRWHWTLFHYKKPTNHVTYSVAGRVSNGVWRAATGSEPWAFDEFALRLPSWLAALAAIAAAGLLARRWGSPAAGVAAAFFLAVHPWFVRFGAEGRAYAFVVLLSLLAALALTRALRRGLWRDHAVYAGLQWLLLWTHPFAVYLATSMGVFGLGGALAGRGDAATRARAASRFAVANLLAGMALLQVFAPNFAQSVLFSDVNAPTASRLVDARTVERISAALVAGVPRSLPRREPDTGAYPSLDRWAAERAWVDPAVSWVLPGVALMGLARVVARGGAGRWAALGLGLALPLSLAGASLLQQFFHLRFAIFGLAAVVVFLPIGIEGLLRAASLGREDVRRRLVPAGLAAALLLYQLGVRSQTRLLVERPFSGMKQTAAFVSARAGDDPTSVLRAGLGTGGDLPALYDPWIVGIRGRGELVALMERARSEGKPLYVFYGYEGDNREEAAGAFRILDDPALFEPVARFPAIVPGFRYRVMRYTGAAFGGSG